MKPLIKLENEPDVFIVNNVNEFLNPLCIYIPLNATKVKEGQYFYKDTYLDNNLISISGYATLSNPKLFNGKWQKSIKIDNDFKENLSEKKIKPKVKTKEDLIVALEASHLEKIKDKINITQIDNLVISCFDEEIYEMNEFMCLAENYKELLKVIDDLKKILSLDKVTLAIKNTNVKGIKKVKSIKGVYPDLQIMLLPDRYLMSYPNNLCSYLNIPNAHTLILTTNEVYQIMEILKGKKISEIYLTISGNALKKSLIFKTKVGVSLIEIIKNYLKITSSSYEVYLNGYLKGVKMPSIDDVIITEDTKSIVIKKELEEEVSECINCGACMKICPVNINVKKCFFEGYQSKKCLGCGLCNYICPANLKLKEMVRGDNSAQDEN